MVAQCQDLYQTRLNQWRLTRPCLQIHHGQQGWNSERPKYNIEQSTPDEIVSNFGPKSDQSQSKKMPAKNFSLLFGVLTSLLEPCYSLGYG